MFENLSFFKHKISPKIFECLERFPNIFINIGDSGCGDNLATAPSATPIYDQNISASSLLCPAPMCAFIHAKCKLTYFHTEGRRYALALLEGGGSAGFTTPHIFKLALLKSVHCYIFTAYHISTTPNTSKSS